MYKIRGVFFTEPGVRAVGDLGWIESNSRPTNCEKWTSSRRKLGCPIHLARTHSARQKKGGLLIGERV